MKSWEFTPLLNSNIYLEKSGIVLTNFIHIGLTDLMFVWSMRNSSEVMQGMLSDRGIGQSEHIEFAKKLIDDDYNAYWLVRNSSDESTLGVIYLNNIDFESGVAELGLYKNFANKNKGIGDTLLDTLDHVAFNILKLRKLWLQVLATNEVALTLYERHYYNIVGQLNRHVKKEGKYRPVILMEKFIM